MTAVRPFLEKDLEKRGASLLFWYTWPQQNIWGRGDPVRSLADLKGRRIRGTTPEEADMVRSLGATPVTLTTEEVPTAMQRGLMDGLISAAFNVLGARWYEFIRWAYVAEIRLSPSYIVVNDQALAALSPEVRKALEDTAAEFQARMVKEVIQQEAAARKTLSEEHGIRFYTASQEDVRAMEGLMSGYWDDWARKAGPDVAEALKAVRQVTGR
ncbi:MAG: TRAP transporter substrate-binding protein DctP [Clostridia bacterium]|nr:TRAP transporter substrate-binding protein DctP [Clostridia bacterium]